jgi:hypothetical protein
MRAAARNQAAKSRLFLAISRLRGTLLRRDFAIFAVRIPYLTIIKCVTALGVHCVAGACFAGAVLHVDDDAAAGGDGAAWQSAFAHLQDALLLASNPANGITEIRVGQGVYRPDQSQDNASGLGDRNATFRLISAVAIKGGYLGLSAGDGEDPNARDVEQYLTVLSGDLAGDDPPAPPPGEVVAIEAFANGADNAYQVVTALNVDDTAILDGLTITGGHADGPGFGAAPESKEQGSGLNVYFASPTIINCTFLRNWNNNHGAVNDHGDFTTLIDCTFRANYALLFGGGMYSHHHSASTLTNCKFYDNFTPGDGAGAYSRSMRFAAYTNCEFHNNLALNKGGGMYNAPGSTTVHTHCTITGNRALFGGGIYSDESNSMISWSTMQDNVAQSQGGAMYNNLGAPTVFRCLFIANDADGGGGGQWNADSNVSITYCTYESNTSEGGGAGLYNLGGAPSVFDCEFIANSSSGAGGGLWNGLNSPVIVNCAFIENIAAHGGGMYNTDQSAPSVNNCMFIGNHAEEGGGLYNFDSNSTVINCTFEGNTASGGKFPVGGGMINYFCSPTISQCAFRDNVAERGGGGMYNEGEAPVIRNCAFTRNRAEGDYAWGGGMLNGYYVSAEICNCLFLGNSARFGGGAFNITFAAPTVINCDFIGNVAEESGGGIYNFADSAATIENSIIWHNVPGAIDGSSGVVKHNCIEGGFGPPRDGNIDAYPQFVSPPQAGPDAAWGSADDDYGNLVLAGGSPCIDVGDNIIVPLAVTIDAAGLPRFVDDREVPDGGVPDGLRPPIDMGAFEYQPAQCPADIGGAGGQPDGVVNVVDLLMVIDMWGVWPAGSPADINMDGWVNVLDLLAVISSWGQCQ